MGIRRVSPNERVIHDRVPPDNDMPSMGAPAGRRFRAALRQATVIAASPVSGLWTSCLLMACMVGVAIAIPGILHLPKWVEAESVLFAWWLLWVLTLAILLYRGWRISDDHVLAKPRTPWSLRDTGAEPAGGRKRGGPGCDPSSGCLEFGCSDGLVEGLAAILILAVVALGAWVFVELVAPALFFFVYFLVRNSLAPPGRAGLMPCRATVLKPAFMRAMLGSCGVAQSQGPGRTLINRFEPWVRYLG